MALWIAAFLISMTWLYSGHLHVYANHWATAALAVAGIATFTLALRKKVDFSRVSPAWGLLLIPLIAGFLIAGFPESFGPGLLILGVAALLLCRGYRGLSSLAAGLLASGSILTLQALSFGLYFNYVAKDPHVPALSGIVFAILEYLGLRASMSGGVIYVQMMRYNYPFPTAWANLALLPVLQMWVAAAVMIPLFGGKPAHGVRALWAFILGMCYIIVRYTLMLLAFVYLMYFVGYFEENLRMDIFWNRWLTVLTMLPLVLIFAKAFPLKRSGDAITAGFRFDHFGNDLSLRKALTVAAAACGTFFFVAYIGFWDPGTPKQGRVLLDEKYSDWEVSTTAYDTKWYGNESGYNYWSMADLMSYYFRVDKTEEKPLTKELLSNYDVVLLKNPTFPYPAEEVDAMLEFVLNGGGIFLMGEHTNVFGTSVPLNEVGRRLGFFFRYDSVFDMEEKFECLWHVPELMPSPVVQNQDNFLFATPCSVEPTSYLGRTRNAAVGPGLWSLPIEYASGNFYPQVKLRTDMTYGPLVTMITSTMGKGRAVGFSDSTTFSNFSSQLPGKPEMLLSSMHWLNHRNRFTWLNSVFLVLSIACFTGMAAAAWGTPRHQGTRLAALAVGIGVAGLSMSIFTGLARSAYPLPQPVRPLPKVVFEREYSEYEIPTSGFVKDQKKSFAIFYQWVLRLQYFPFLQDTVQAALDENPHILVMINPSKVTPPDRDFVKLEDTQRVRDVLVNQQLKPYLERGGKVLLMDDAENDKSLSRVILEEFGMHLDVPYRRPGTQQAMTMLMDPRGAPICTASAGCTIVGADEDLVKSSDGKVVLARKRVGKGSLVVMAASKRFCDTNMGYSQSTKPGNADTVKAFYLEFAIFRGMMNDNLEDELTTIGQKLSAVGVQ